MKSHFIIFIFIFLLSCSLNKKHEGVNNNNSVDDEISPTKNYSFEEYVNLLLKKNISKTYPDINKIPD